MGNNKIIQVAIPEGKKYKNFESSDNKIIINLEDNFRDGDYITVEGMTFISKGGSNTNYYVLTNNNCDQLNFNSYCGYSKDLYTPRLSTISEINMLDDKLRKYGKKWNTETKTIDDLPRWRGKNGDIYYFISTNLTIQESVERDYRMDDNNYYSGNYFKTLSTAYKVLSEIKKIIEDNIEY